MNQNSGTFEAPIRQGITKAQDVDHVRAMDYFARSWRVRFAAWVNRWWYKGV